MFKVLDRTQKQIHTDDTVTLSECTPGGLNYLTPEGTPAEFYVANILSETEIVIVPTGKGIPERISPDKVTVIRSLLGDLENLATDEELQAILAGVESKLADTRKPREKTIRESEEPTLDIGI